MSYGDHLQGGLSIAVDGHYPKKSSGVGRCTSSVVVGEKKSCFALACLLNLDMCSGLMLFSGSDYV